MSLPPLTGTRILELGDYVSAAYCAKLLGEYGAEVIKVEPPGTGDSARKHGPFPEGTPDPESSGLFLFLNTSKLGVTLDLHTPAGIDIVQELVRQCDVVVHNYLPQELEALSLTYAQLQSINPSIVMTNVTTFGHVGPYARYKAYSLAGSAAGGAAHRIGSPERYPLAMPHQRADLWGGLNGAPATMLALMTRRRDGLGQVVDISSSECLNAFGNGNDLIIYADSGSITRRHGTRTPIQYPYTILPCKDGYFAMIIGNEHHWQRWIKMMGNPEWTKNPRYQDRVAMGFEYPEEVDALLKPWMMQHTKHELWAMCRERGIPWHAVQTVDDTMEWDLLKDRGFWEEQRDGQGRMWKLPGPTFKMQRTPAAPFRSSPTLGQHNDFVYGELLGIPQPERAALREKGVI